MSTFEEKFRRAVEDLQAGRLAQAQAAGRTLLQRRPGHPGVLQLLGEVAWQQGGRALAQDLFAKAVAANPADAQARCRLANVLLAQREIEAAAEHYRQVLVLQPDYWQASVNLGLLWRSEGRFQEARNYLEQALRNGPELTVVFFYLIDLLLSLGELDTLDALRPRIASVVRRCLSVDQERDYAALMYLAPLLSLPADDLAALGRKQDAVLRKPVRDLFANEPRQDGKIRIGYVSPDFGDHPISHVMLSLFGQHDRERFEVFAYSLNIRSGDVDRRYADTIARSCDTYVDLTGQAVTQAVARIRQDGIGILVNLSGYMSPESLALFSWRPAPVQIYWLGHGGGLGLSFIDYVIADQMVVPAGEEGLYTEKVLRLPEVYHCADTPPVPEIAQTRAENGLDEHAFVFCAFNNPNKIDREVFDAWMNILRRVPNSQLWLSAPGGEGALERNLRAQAQRRGVDPQRLVFARRLPDKALHFARHRLADLFLDTFAYTAATTALDALWAGLPVLTRPGDTFYSRICASFVANVGLADMICASTQEYEDRAVVWAADRDGLRALRKRLAENLRTEPLFNVPRFVSHLEDGYRAVWQRHLAGEAPAAIDVPARPSRG